MGNLSRPTMETMIAGAVVTVLKAQVMEVGVTEADDGLALELKQN